MRVEASVSGDWKQTISWLTKAQTKTPTKSLNKIGQDGVRALGIATPKGETGLTSRGWDYNVETGHNSSEVAFTNNAHPGESINIARAIQYGHATGTGGWVPPYDYINPAMTPILNRGVDLIAKEMFE